MKTQIAMPFGRSSTITLIKRIEYRAICAVEVCAFGKIFEFSHRLDPQRPYALPRSSRSDRGQFVVDARAEKPYDKCADQPVTLNDRRLARAS